MRSCLRAKSEGKTDKSEESTERTQRSKTRLTENHVTPAIAFDFA